MRVLLSFTEWEYMGLSIFLAVALQLAHLYSNMKNEHCYLQGL